MGTEIIFLTTDENRGMMVGMEAKTMKKEWRHILTIPGYLVQGIGDSGMYETEIDGERDKDDLRISITISTMEIVLDGHMRIVLKDNGDIEIQSFVEVKDDQT